jgi:phage/plasmid primase-like uncharacterized protein
MQEKFIEDEVMADLTNILGGPWTPPRKTHLTPEQQLIDAIESAGLTPPDEVILDGKLRRFGRKKTSWYVAYGDGIPAGAFGDWKEAIEINFRAEIERDLTLAENMAVSRRLAEAKAQRKAEEAKKHEVASNTVQSIWDQAGLASAEHEYIARKGIQAHGVRITGDGRLMVPLYHKGELASIQYIDRDGEKRYHAGGKTGGCFWSIGEPTETIYIAEGFATAATIYETTGRMTYISFSASNLVPVVETVRKIHPKTTIIVVADNDTSGVGKAYAEQAVAKFGGSVVMPPVPGMDANDYHQAGHDLMALLEPPKSDWLIPASDYAAQPAPISWIIKHHVQDKALIMAHGPSGGGKTFIVLDWCLHIATQKDNWFGNKVHGGSVVYLAGEGHHGLRSRIAAWSQHHKTPIDNMWISSTGCDLNTPEGYSRVRESVRQLPGTPKMIVVDTLHRFLLGDENSAQDAKTMLDACNSLMAEFDCTVLLVHHTGVSDEAQHRARGSSAWRGALDIEVSIVPGKKDKPIEIVQRKSKDSELAPTVFVQLQSQAIDGWIDEDGEAVSSAVLVEGTPVEKADHTTVNNKKFFENMWHESGRDIFCGHPFVSNAFARSVFEQKHSAGTAKKYSLGIEDKGPLGQLKLKGMLRKDSSGWICDDSAWSAAMQLGGSQKVTNGSL